MPRAPSPLADLDWASIAALRLRARAAADGLYAGAHRSHRRGPGVEFGGNRPYVPGDDLRWLDRRALLRHERLLVREFETETDRGLRLLVDASASMGFTGDAARPTKLQYASVVAAALGRLALASGDPVGLAFVAGQDARPLAASAGRESFDRLAFALASTRPGGDATLDTAAFDRALAPILRRAHRGTIVVLLSDLLDLPDDAAAHLAALAGRGHVLVVAQVLDPVEATFPFEGTVRLRALEGASVVEADAASARAPYLRALADLTDGWQRVLDRVGGYLVRAVTDADPASAVRAIVTATSGRAARREARA